MLTNIKNKLNSVLDNNTAINDAYQLKEKIKEIRKGQRIKRILSLILSSFVSIFLSFLASVLSFTTPQYSMLILFCCSAVTILINCYVFVGFLKGTRREKFDYKDAQEVTSRLITLVISALVIVMLQTFIASILSAVSLISTQLQGFLSSAFSLIFMFLSALIAFEIFDGEQNFRLILIQPVKLLKKHIKELFLCSIMFILFSFIFNIVYTVLIYDHLIEVQNINHIIHALLNLKEYALLGRLLIYYGFAFTVGAYLQCDLLLGLGIVYDKDSKGRKQ